MEYIARPILVTAYRITGVSEKLDSDRGVRITTDDGSGGQEVRYADKTMLARMTPQIGDYWVRQSDGYVYLNPKDVFESKYRPRVMTPAETASPTETEHIMQFFEYAHLTSQPAREASQPFCELAKHILATTPRNPERTVALRKVLEAKDAGVRARIAK